jgi:predicted dienelactone hydrolase
MFMSIFPKKTRFLVAFASSVVTTIITATVTLASENIFFIYTPLRFSLSISSLEEFAASGTVDENLAFYMRLANATEAEKQDFRENINAAIPVDPVRLSRFLNTRIGEDFLTRIGYLINIQGGRNGKYPIRGALIKAAFSQEGLSLISFLRELPVNVQVDLRQVEAFVARINHVIEATRLFTEETARLSAQEILNTPEINYSELPDLTQPGSRKITTETWTLNDINGDRTFYVIVYYPEGNLNPNTPVVIISHGLASRPEDFAVNAIHLASHGYLVAIPQHPGSDWQQMQNMLNGLSRSLTISTEFVDRPQRISLVIDELEKRNQTQFGGNLNVERVGAFGHSFGGYDVLALAGATIDFNRLESQCDLNRVRGNTSLLLQCRALDLNRTEYNFRDERIVAVYGANPVNSALFGPEGLGKISIPVFIGAGNYDPATPFVFEQVSSFPWLTTPNKYLLLQEGQAHVDFSQLDAGLSDIVSAHLNTTLPAPELLHKYTNSTLLAFFQTHLVEDDEYEVFLRPAYLAYLSLDQDFKAFMITAASSEELSQGIQEFRREKGID